MYVSVCVCVRACNKPENIKSVPIFLELPLVASPGTWLWLGLDLLDIIQKNEDQAWNIFDAVVITQICCNSRENRKKSMKRSHRFVFQKLIRNFLQMSWILRVPDTMIQAQIVLALWCEGLMWRAFGGGATISPISADFIISSRLGLCCGMSRLRLVHPESR